MTNPFGIFKIKREERLPALAVLLVSAALNALLVASHWDMYTKPLLHGGAWSAFTTRFEMSGYDCWSWLTLTEGRVDFETVRHPLYLTFLYPLYWLNHWLMSWTGVNWAVFIMSTIAVVSAVYSAVFVYRILRELLGLRRMDACLLVALLFSFGHVMVAAMVPDHFIISMMLLTMNAYICGKKMKKGLWLKTWQTALLLFFTSGMAASNGVKTLIGGWFVNGRRFLRPRHVLLGVVLPLAALLAIQRVQYYEIEVPRFHQAARTAKAVQKDANAKSPAATTGRQKANRPYNGGQRQEGGLLELMDFHTPRLPIFVEDLCGESLLLHKSHALEDELRTRPAAVPYGSWWCYAAVAVVFALAIGGMWCGRKERLMQMLLCWLCFDFFLSMVLGFAVREVYIMTAGWAFTLPIATGYAFRKWSAGRLWVLRSLIFMLALTLAVSNLRLVIAHLC